MKPYASDLSDAEWTILEPLIPPAKPGGRPRSVNMRQILNGIFYVLRSGCAWRRLSHDYPACSTLVDTLGLLLKVVVHRADIQDREGVPFLLEPVKGQFPRIEKVWVDNGYTGSGRAWIKEHMGWEVEVVSHPRRPRGMWVFPGEEIDYSLFERRKGFRHLPRRWVVERTLAWIGRYRRMSKDYEYLTSSSEAMVYLTMLRLMLTRLAKQNEQQFVKYKQTHAA